MIVCCYYPPGGLSYMFVTLCRQRIPYNVTVFGPGFPSEFPAATVRLGVAAPTLPPRPVPSPQLTFVMGMLRNYSAIPADVLE